MTQKRYSQDQPKQTIEELVDELYPNFAVGKMDFIQGYNHAQTEIDMSQLDLELNNIDLEKTKKLLKHCENALQQRDETIEELRRDKDELLQFIIEVKKTTTSKIIFDKSQQLITKHK